jgi:hypothetical protein
VEVSANHIFAVKLPGWTNTYTSQKTILNLQLVMQVILIAKVGLHF